MYGGMPGGGMMGNDPNSLTHRFNNSTAATFQMLEGIVTAFGGFAQMLESTYMATHSSFFGTFLRHLYPYIGTGMLTRSQLWCPLLSSLATCATL